MAELAGLEEVRPGRTLFAWRPVLSAQSASSSPTSSSPTTVINLILVHGTAAAHNQFRPLMESIKSILPPELSIACLLYDCVGCGQSPALPDRDAYSDAHQVEDLRALVKTLDTNRPTFFLAHSYGPMTVLKYLKEHTLEHLGGCIFLSTGLKGGPGPLVDGGPPIFKLPLFILNCLQSLLTESFLQTGFAKGTSPKILNAARVDCNRNPMKVVQYYYQSHRILTGADAKETLGDCRCLVLHGAEDGLVPVSSGQHVANELQAELHVVDYASHMIMVEQPDAVAQLVMDFLKSNVQAKLDYL